MVTLALDIEESIRRFVIKVRSQYDVQAIYLFGSRASGKADEWSDVDLLVISPDFSKDRFESQVALLTLASRIDTRLEPHPLPPEDFNINNHLAYEVQRAGVRISIDSKRRRPMIQFHPRQQKKRPAGLPAACHFSTFTN